MSRPQPKILAASPRPWTTLDHDELQVCESPEVYVVAYKGVPISLRAGPADGKYPGFKYHRNSWPSPGHAHNQAQRLNQLFGCEDYQVWLMRPHKIVQEPKPTPRRFDPDWQPAALSAAGIVPQPGDRVKPF